MINHVEPTLTIGDRYHLLNLLGEGGMGSVYRALDRLTSQHVALKRVETNAADLMFASRQSSTDGDARVALALEFQTLASLRHPNIISVLDYGFDAQRQPYFTMDLLESPTTILEAAVGKALAVQVGLLAQMLRALAYLHRRNIIHRDLKPGNVLVQGDQVKVVDFGLAVAADQAREAAGTLPYMAPELFEGQAVISVASDLYSVGIIIYEIFSGDVPFSLGAGGLLPFMKCVLAGVIDFSKLHLDPPLIGVLQRLLARSPGARFASASEALDALSQAIGMALPHETSATRESFLQAARLIGREAEVAQLTSALKESTVGHGSLWLIGGESGVGKSRLLEEIRIRGMVLGVLALRGQAASVGGAIYQLWQDILRRLVISADLSDLEAGILKPLVPDIATLLGHGVPNAPELAAKGAQARLFATVGDLVRRQRQPLLLILEDLQWASPDSLELLAWLSRLAPDLSLLILGNYRDDEDADFPRLVPGAHVLKLDRLPDTDIAALSESMLGEAGRREEVVHLLQRETEGNVFFLVEVVRALAEQAGELEKIGATTLPAHVLAGGMQRIIRRRLDRVPAKDRDLLELAAVAGRILDLGVLQEFKRAANLDAWLTECADAAVIALQDNRWQFAHDKLREQMLEDIPTDSLGGLHRQVALAIEAAYPDPTAQAAALAYHWRMAGNADKESPYALLAGEQAAERYANEEAIVYLQRALELLTAPSQRARATLKLAEVWQLTGKWIEAEGAYRQAVALAAEAQDMALEARCRLRFAGLFIYRNVGQEARAMLEQAIVCYRALGDRLGLANARGKLGLVHSERGEYPQAIECLQEQAQIAEALGDQHVLQDALGDIGLVYHYQGNYPAALDYLARGLELAVQIGDRVGVMTSTINIGITYAMQEDYLQGLESFSRTLQIAAEINSRREYSIALGNIGETYLLLGQYDYALDCLKQRLRIALEMSERRGIHIVMTNLARVYSALGDHPQAGQLWTRALALGRLLNSPYYLANALLNYADWCREQQRFAESRAMNDEAAAIAAQIGRKDAIFGTAVLAIQLRAAMGDCACEAAISELESLLKDWPEAPKQAELHYAIWQLDHAQGQHQHSAASLYRDTYARTFTLRFRQRYEEMTGQKLAEVPPVAPPPQIALRYPVDFAALLRQVDALLAG